MMPKTIYHFIAPHIEGYSDKDKEKLIKMIRREDEILKPKPMTKEQLFDLELKKRLEKLI